MKNFIQLMLGVLSLIFVFSCETAQEPPSVINSDSFSETELAALIEHNVAGFEVEPASRHRGTLKSLNPVIDPINGGMTVGNSLLLRKEQVIAMGLKSHLVPKHAYTIWWVVWNFPENCTVPGACSDVDFAIAEEVGVDVMYAGGNVASGNGVGTFSGQLHEGDVSGSINELLGLAPLGLLDAMKAEVHLVVRSHGPGIPGELEDQIGSYEGGCMVFFEPFTEIPDATGECGDIQFAIHQP